MTKESISKPNVTKSEITNSNKISGVSFEDALDSSGGLGASIKPGKRERSSLDSTEKGGGGTKIPKLDDLSNDKKDQGSSGANGKDNIQKSKDDKKKKDIMENGESKASSSSSAPTATKKLQCIQESSLFMDALTRETTSKSKRRKRKKEGESSSNTSPKDATIISTVGPSSSSSGSNDNIKSLKENNQAQNVQPVFNFQRDTLNDGDQDNELNLKTTAEGEQDLMTTTDSVSGAAEGVASMTSDITTTTTNTLPSDTTNTQGDDFAPAEGEGKLKSCLCIHRPKGGPKKAVKWRQDEELKEYHFFEMDETERVNVASRPEKNFTEMKLFEQNEEKKVVLQNKKMHNDSMEEQTPWRSPLRKVYVYVDPSIPSPKIDSKEQIIQEERERGILQVFYFPGTPLPDHPSEAGVVDFQFDRAIPSNTIPADDIPGQTKLYDLRHIPWPKPNTLSNDPDNPWSLSFAASVGNIPNIPWNANNIPQGMPGGFHAFPTPFGFPPVPPFGFPGPPPTPAMMGPMQAPPRFHTTQNANNGRDNGQPHFNRHSFQTR